ncbi:MAG: hypothetical protein HOH43_26880 [Candidatus Latescibacteria bacterium]|jgi:hypothetical protein|nr:hypothetical protein [Candidatus Latescibacterota bacterium]
MTELAIDILGWLGTAMLVIGYILVSSRKVHGQSMLYQMLNLLGSVLLGVNSYYYGAMPSVGINIMWVGIGAWAILQIFKSPHLTQSPT